MTRHSDYVGVYGNTQLAKVYCEYCECYTFVRDGLTVCCGEPVKVKAKKLVQESSPREKRYKPKKEDKKKILNRQKNKCIYCGRDFGSLAVVKDKVVELRVHWDHKIPYSYSFNNKGNNFVAACHVCNRLKSNTVFETIEDAQIYLERRWGYKGYTDLGDK